MDLFMGIREVWVHQDLHANWAARIVTARSQETPDIFLRHKNNIMGLQKAARSVELLHYPL